MSKKGKAILASALFGAAIFGASCGGDDGGTSAPTGGPPSGPPPGDSAPPPTSIGKALILTSGTLFVGPNRAVRLCDIFSNQTVVCGSDLNPDGDQLFEYLHEFSNEKVILRDPNNFLNFYNGTALVKVENRRYFTDATTTTTDTAHLKTANAAAIETVLGENFVVVRNAAGNVTHVITSEGNYVDFTTGGLPNIDLVYMGKNYVVVAQSAGADQDAYLIKTDGSVTRLDFKTPGTTPQLLARDGDNIVVAPLNSGNLQPVFVIRENGTVAKITVANLNLPNTASAQIKKVGTDLFVAVNSDDAGPGGGNGMIRYAKVTPTHVYADDVDVSTNVKNNTPNRGDYGLDGQGRLYAIVTNNAATDDQADEALVAYFDANNQVQSKSAAIPGTPAGANASLITFSDRALLRDTTGAGASYTVTIVAGPNVNVTATTLDAAAADAYDNVCIHAKRTPPNAIVTLADDFFIGEGTDEVMCVRDPAGDGLGSGNEEHAYLRSTGVAYFGARSVNLDIEHNLALAPNRMIVGDFPDSNYSNCLSGTCSLVSLSAARPQNLNLTRVKTDKNIHVNDAAGFRGIPTPVSVFHQVGVNNDIPYKFDFTNNTSSNLVTGGTTIFSGGHVSLDLSKFAIIAQGTPNPCPVVGGQITGSRLFYSAPSVTNNLFDIKDSAGNTLCAIRVYQVK